MCFSLEVSLLLGNKLYVVCFVLFFEGVSKKSFIKGNDSQLKIEVLLISNA